MISIFKAFYTSILTLQLYVMPVDIFETLGVMLLIGPLVATVGGIIYATITDAFRGSHPRFRLSILPRGNDQGDLEKDESRKDSEVQEYIDELKKRRN